MNKKKPDKKLSGTLEYYFQFIHSTATTSSGVSLSLTTDS